MSRRSISAAFTWLVILTSLAPASGQAGKRAHALQRVTSLQADATLSALIHRPIIILFSLPGCHFCDEVRQNYLLPLLNDAIPADRPILREIVLTGSEQITGFTGEKTSEQLIAKSYGVRVAPSVLMLDASGALLVPAVVGGDTSGLYGGYLSGALSVATRLIQKK